MKFTAALVPFVLLAGQALAQSQQTLARLPPGCLLHAVNTQDEPSDLDSVCGNSAKEVQQAIASICKDNVVSQAQAAFIATCSSAGKSVAAYTATSTGSSKGSKTTASPGNVITTTDADGRVITRTAAGAQSTTPNAAPMVTQKAAGGYVAVVIAVVAVAAI